MQKAHILANLLYKRRKSQFCHFIQEPSHKNDTSVSNAKISTKQGSACVSTSMLIWLQRVWLRCKIYLEPGKKADKWEWAANFWTRALPKAFIVQICRETHWLHSTLRAQRRFCRVEGAIFSPKSSTLFCTQKIIFTSNGKFAWLHAECKIYTPPPSLSVCALDFAPRTFLSD